MNGFIIADKPVGMTSSDLVVFVRRRLPRGTAIGHGGTLDPDASGVLPLCVGKGTRLFDYIIDKTKTYRAELTLGIQTDTQDATGQVISACEVQVGARELEAVLPRFVGEIEQIPPMYSAIKQGGKRLYALARRGETVQRQARKCRVDAIRYCGQTGEHSYAVEVDCGKGVYIRTLCHDIGNALGCGAHMSALRRTAAGAFTLADARTPEALADLAERGALEQALLPMDAPLNHIPAVHVGEQYRHAVRNGNRLKSEWLEAPAPEIGTIARVYLSGAFAGIGEMMPDGTVRFRAMLLEAEP